MKPIVRIVQQRFPYPHQLLSSPLVTTVERWYNGSPEDGRPSAKLDVPPNLPFTADQLRAYAAHLVDVATWIDGGCP